ncbi:hypothetical protein [Nostoc sp. PCC 9305]
MYRFVAPVSLPPASSSAGVAYLRDIAAVRQRHRRTAAMSLDIWASALT